MAVCDKCGGVGMQQRQLSAEEITMPGKTSVLLFCDCVDSSILWKRAGIPTRYKDVPERALYVPPGALLLGQPGRGKTYTAIGMLKSWIRTTRLYGARFVDLQDLEQQRRIAIAKGNPLPGEDILHSPFLVADDLGRGERLTNFWGEYLTSLIYTRYNFKLPTVWTSNFTIEELADKIGSHLSGRVVEMSLPHVYQMPNKNWRDMNAS